MAQKIFNVVRSIPILQGQAQRMKIFANPQTKSNTSTMDLNNKRLFFWLPQLPCILITNILQRDPLCWSTTFGLLPTLLIDLPPENVDYSSRIIRMVLLPKNSYIITQILKELILISMSQMIQSIIKSFIHSKSKYKHINLSI